MSRFKTFQLKGALPSISLYAMPAASERRICASFSKVARLGIKGHLPFEVIYVDTAVPERPGRSLVAELAEVSFGSLQIKTNHSTITTEYGTTFYHIEGFDRQRRPEMAGLYVNCNNRSLIFPYPVSSEPIVGLPPRVAWTIGQSNGMEFVHAWNERTTHLV